MAIYLVQHGLAMSKEADSSQGLTPEGIKEVRRIAEVAAHYGIRVESIVHSGAARAKQTADILDTAIESSRGVSVRKGISPMDQVSLVAAKLDPESNLMLVGHLPFMERLVSLLTTGSEEFRPFKFQNGGVVCLDRDHDGENWYVKWTLMPEIS